MATGCVAFPIDGSEVSSRHSSIGVSGLTDQPSQTVTIYAKDHTANDTWRTIATTKTDSVASTTGPNSGDGFAYATSIVLASNYWENSFGCTKTLGAAEIKVVAGSGTLATFNQTAHDCAEDVYNDTNEWLEAVGDCFSGTTVKLFTRSCQ